MQQRSYAVVYNLRTESFELEERTNNAPFINGLYTICTTGQGWSILGLLTSSVVVLPICVSKEFKLPWWKSFLVSWGALAVSTRLGVGFANMLQAEWERSIIGTQDQNW